MVWWFLSLRVTPTPRAVLASGLGHSRRSQHVVFFLAMKVPCHGVVANGWSQWKATSDQGGVSSLGRWRSPQISYLNQGKLMGILPGIPISAPVISNTCPVHTHVSRVRVPWTGLHVRLSFSPSAGHAPNLGIVMHTFSRNSPILWCENKGELIKYVCSKDLLVIKWTYNPIQYLQIKCHNHMYIVINILNSIYLCIYIYKYIYTCIYRI